MKGWKVDFGAWLKGTSAFLEDYGICVETFLLLLRTSKHVIDVTVRVFSPSTPPTTGQVVITIVIVIIFIIMHATVIPQK